MKPLFTCMLSLLSLCCFAQPATKPVNIILTGKVRSFEAKEKLYIYFALAGKKFKLRDRIKMDTSEGYIFDLSKTSYKNTTTGVLVFSLDTTYDMNDKYSCVHRIDVGEINKFAAAKKMSRLKLSSDLVMDWMCESSIMTEEAGEGLSHIVGKFQQVVKDSVQTFEMGNSGFLFNASSNFMDKNGMNASHGKWEYKHDGNAVAIHTWYRINKQFGTMLAIYETKLYRIGNENGKIVLVPESGKSFVRQYE